ncbi:uncharacterized protein CCOS01_15247 [Colletotrichum costaricense]|uniref:Uncharacterized protein n=1 Tax=Colletotrichum costaricense TaxID=1209916 RepID=A0AAI9YHX4_9PEZI|nr:uncharacterized protein CCOS01_15247 [Colletotrichum costaricense]KAK1510416.1 hypothetical protein CCOS01_15247 [Colletotrichum costaricense]
MEDDAKKTITTIRSRHQPPACEEKGVYGVASRVHNYAQGVSARTDESRPTGDGEPKGDKPQGPPQRNRRRRQPPAIALPEIRWTGDRTVPSGPERGDTWCA